MISLSGFTQEINLTKVHLEKHDWTAVDNIQLKTDEILRVFCTNKGSSDSIIINKYDSTGNFKQIISYVTIKNPRYVGHQFNSDSSSLYVLYMSPTDKKGELLIINPLNYKYDNQTFDIEEYTEINEFIFADSYFLAKTNTRSNKVAYKKYSLDFKTSELLNVFPPSLEKTEDLYIHKSHYDKNNKTCYIIYSIEGLKSHRTIAKTIVNGQLSSDEIILDKKDSVFYKYVNCTNLNDSIIVFSGTFDSKRTTKSLNSLDNFRESTGIFVSFYRIKSKKINTQFLHYTEMDRIFAWVNRSTLRDVANNKRTKALSKNDVEYVNFKMYPNTAIITDYGIHLTFNSFSRFHVTGGPGNDMISFPFVLTVLVNKDGNIIAHNTVDNEAYILGQGSDGVHNPGDIFRGLSYFTPENVTIFVPHLIKNELVFFVRNGADFKYHKLDPKSLDTLESKIIKNPIDIKNVYGKSYALKTKDNNLIIIGSFAININNPLKYNFKTLTAFLSLQ
jgi:hypothetical protein